MTPSFHFSMSFSCPARASACRVSKFRLVSPALRRGSGHRLDWATPNPSAISSCHETATPASAPAGRGLCTPPKITCGPRTRCPLARLSPVSIHRPASAGASTLARPRPRLSISRSSLSLSLSVKRATRIAVPPLAVRRLAVMTCAVATTRPPAVFAAGRTRTFRLSAQDPPPSTFARNRRSLSNCSSAKPSNFFAATFSKA